MRRRARPAALVVTDRRAAKIQCLHSYATDAKKIVGSFTPVKVSLPLALITFSVGPGLDPFAGDKGRDVLVGGTSIDSIAGGEGATTSFCSMPSTVRRRHRHGSFRRRGSDSLSAGRWRDRD